MADDKDKPKQSSGRGQFSLGGIGKLKPVDIQQNIDNSGQSKSSEQEKK